MNFSTVGIYIAAIIFSYLLGSIPSAYLLGRRYQVDIRTKGSGNVGTMNTRTTLGWKPALLVLACDLAKGMAAVFIAQMAGINPMLAGSIAVAGHIYPVWLNFQGGKGLAAAAGALIAAGYFVTVIAFLLVSLSTYPLLKQIDRSSLIGLAAAIIISAMVYGWDSFLILLAFIICIKHIDVLNKKKQSSA
ncbi:acyl-phosphate:glycerol-3-phosphate o-acyltransferase plsy [hydrocarbon metagenome]|uniref:Acyl-phosphate:glycerol-3-phosphate o-acyltransferase plsy n=1 Tax=hydrocarbon metagenome TaxID=938273 RepID=A0A0W8E4Y7_9ZZZZ